MFLNLQTTLGVQNYINEVKFGESLLQVNPENIFLMACCLQV
jgi:hypothetical protein